MVYSRGNSIYDLVWNGWSPWPSNAMGGYFLQNEIENRLIIFKHADVGSDVCQFFEPITKVVV